MGSEQRRVLKENFLVIDPILDILVGSAVALQRTGRVAQFRLVLADVHVDVL